MKAQDLYTARLHRPIPRTELGLSQEQLAHRSGVHRTFVGHIERGEVNPTLSSLCLLVATQPAGTSATSPASRASG